MGRLIFWPSTCYIRVIDREGNPWFVAKDVCLVLGLALLKNGSPNTAQAVRPLNEDEKGIYPIYTGAPAAPDHRQRVWLISESGLYRLVMRSDKSEARSFQDWVTRVVLPAIRKDGGYVLGEEKLATGEMTEGAGGNGPEAFI